MNSGQRVIVTATREIIVTDMPSHTRTAEQAWRVISIGEGGHRQLGVVERYPDKTWHVAGRHYATFGWVKFPTRRAAVKAIVEADGLNVVLGA